MSDNVLDSKIPAGAIADKWDNYKADMKLVNPNNKRKFKVLEGPVAASLVISTALAGMTTPLVLALTHLGL